MEGFLVCRMTRNSETRGYGTLAIEFLKTVTSRSNLWRTVTSDPNYSPYGTKNGVGRF